MSSWLFRTRGHSDGLSQGTIPAGWLSIALAAACLALRGVVFGFAETPSLRHILGLDDSDPMGPVSGVVHLEDALLLVVALVALSVGVVQIWRGSTR